jgi:hypothetical protein
LFFSASVSVNTGYRILPLRESKSKKTHSSNPNFLRLFVRLGVADFLFSSVCNEYDTHFIPLQISESRDSQCALQKPLFISYTHIDKPTLTTPTTGLDQPVSCVAGGIPKHAHDRHPQNRPNPTDGK